MKHEKHERHEKEARAFFPITRICSSEINRAHFETRYFQDFFFSFFFSFFFFLAKSVQWPDFGFTSLEDGKSRDRVWQFLIAPCPLIKFVTQSAGLIG